MVPQIKLKVHGLIQDVEWRHPILEEPSAGFHKEPSAGLHKEPSAGLHKEPSAGFIGSVWWSVNDRSYASATTFTYLRCLGPFTWNCTTPSDMANNV